MRPTKESIQKKIKELDLDGDVYIRGDDRIFVIGDTIPCSQSWYDDDISWYDKKAGEWVHATGTYDDNGKYDLDYDNPEPYGYEDGCYATAVGNIDEIENQKYSYDHWYIITGDRVSSRYGYEMDGVIVRDPIVVAIIG